MGHEGRDRDSSCLSHCSTAPFVPSDLEFHMTTSTLTLREEKQCIIDIKLLNASRKVFG